MNQEEIGKFIAQLRKSKNFTQEELAEELGVSSKAISKWETGVNLPDVSNLVYLAKIFDVSINELIAGKRNISEKTTDENIVKVAKYYKNSTNNKVKKLFLLIIILTVIIIALISNIYLFNNFGNSKLYKINSNDSEYVITGYLMINPIENILIIENINYQGEFFGTDKEPKVSNLKISLNIGNKNYLNYNADERKEKLILSDFLNSVSFSISEEKNDKVNLINTKSNLEDVKMQIEYYDEQDELQVTDIDLKVKEIYSNDKFIYDQNT